MLTHTLNLKPSAWTYFATAGVRLKHTHADDEVSKGVHSKAHSLIMFNFLFELIRKRRLSNDLLNL